MNPLFAQGVAALIAIAATPPAAHGSEKPAKPTASAAPAPPPRDAALPPGHPGVASPHGGDGSGDGLFQAPPDGSADDPSLPVGSILVTVRDADDQPIPNAPVEVVVTRMSVAKGDAPPESLARATDAQGFVRYDGLPTGAGAMLRVRTTKGEASYEAPPFTLGDKVGKHVAVHAYEVVRDIEAARVGMQGIVFVQLKEDTISVQQYFGVMNLGRVAWAPGQAVVELPAGFRALNKQDTMGDARLVEVPKKGVALEGTFGPGQHDLEFRYSVPLEGKEAQTLSIQMPPHMAQARVMVEASRKMGVEVSGFPAAQRTTGRDGKKLLVTERVAQRADGGIPRLEITLSGLPVPGPGRYVALGLALVFAGGGVSYVLRKRREGEAMDADTRSELREAEEALLEEIVALERAHKKGDVGPKTYARVRAALLDALARITARLEAAPKPARASRAKARTAG